MERSGSLAGVAREREHVAGSAAQRGVAGFLGARAVLLLHTEGLCRGARGRAVPGQQMGLWLLFPGPSYLTTSSLHEQLFRSLHWDGTRAAIFLPFFALYTV